MSQLGIIHTNTQLLSTAAVLPVLPASILLEQHAGVSIPCYDHMTDVIQWAWDPSSCLSATVKAWLALFIVQVANHATMAAVAPDMKGSYTINSDLPSYSITTTRAGEYHCTSM